MFSLEKGFKVAFCHRSHYKSKIKLVCIRANNLDEMLVRETLEHFDLLFKIMGSSLIFPEIVSTAEPLAGIGFETESRPNMINISKVSMLALPAIFDTKLVTV